MSVKSNTISSNRYKLAIPTCDTIVFAAKYTCESTNDKLQSAIPGRSVVCLTCVVKTSITISAGIFLINLLHKQNLPLHKKLPLNYHKKNPPKKKTKSGKIKWEKLTQNKSERYVYIIIYINFRKYSHVPLCCKKLLW